MLSIAVLLGLTTMTLAGCGGSSSSKSGGGSTQPAATLTSIAPYQASVYGTNPPWVAAGIQGFSLLANGTNFTSTSMLQWNGTTLPTQFGSSVNLAANVSSSLVAKSGTASITVYDSASGKSSGSLTFSIASPSTSTAGVVQMITVAPDGSPANSSSLVTPSISATGRYIAFQSNATNLGAGVAGAWQQIYERDICIGAPNGCVPSTIPISVTADGSAPNWHSKTTSISADGRYVVYDTQATNILSVVPGCSKSFVIGGVYSGVCTYLRDTCIGAQNGCTPSTTLLARDIQNGSGNPQGAGTPSFSPDGRYIAFESSTLVNGSLTEVQTLLNDTCNGAPVGCTPQTFLASQSTNGVMGESNSVDPSASDGGRFVAFRSYAHNLIPNDTDIWDEIFVRDTCLGIPTGCTPTTTLESMGVGNAYGNGGQDGSSMTSISADGRYVAFSSNSTNLVAQSVTVGSVYVRDTCTGATTNCTPSTSLVSVANDGSLPNGGSHEESMSADGRYIAFASLANNLVPGDTFPVNGWKDIFVRDTCNGAPAGCTPSTVRVSVANQSGYLQEANAISEYPQISADGHYVVFMSEAFNFLPLIGNGYEMVYLAKTGF
jgi:Tol biopolymer transport system component